MGAQFHEELQEGWHSPFTPTSSSACPARPRRRFAKTIDYAKELDAETVQVSVAHAYPGTELYEYAAENGFLATEQRSDGGGHQLPHLVYPGLSLEEMMAGNEPLLRFVLSPSARGVAHREEGAVGCARAQAPV